MSEELYDKSVLVTGSSRGIGRAIAELFLARGAKVAFNGRDAKYLSNLVESLQTCRAISVPGDVTCPDKAQLIVRQVISKFSKIDILVCNVGSGRSVLAGEETYADWLTSLHKNFFSITNIVESAKNSLTHSKGCIICISSICGVEYVPGAPLTYSVAKSALNTYVRGVSRSLGVHGVRINAVAPGNIIFPGSTWDKKINNNPDSVQNMLDHEVALSRLGKPEEIAEVVYWLASSSSSFCTGSIFVADGGQIRCWK
ncbi:short chain dehydrogenase family protein [Synechococcus sp. A18-46.1]|nr:short chain dehydrogenase family protein [Synechococcus sp. A18-46.1]